jgi:hypothetical protein
MNTCFKLNETTRSTVWKFPEQVGFEATTSYLYQLRSIDLSRVITFDLSDTDMVHSSFIGFMIDLKEKVLRNGGVLEVIFSQELRKQFSRMNLYSHFIPEEMSEAI